MTVIVQSKTLPMTSALQAFAKEQATKIFRTGQRVTKVTVFLEAVKRRKNDMKAMTAKIHIDMPGRNIVVQRHAQDMYQAIVDAANRAHHYLNKQKERRIKGHRTSVDWSRLV